QSLSGINAPAELSPPLSDATATSPERQGTQDAKTPSTSCLLCNASFPDLQEQRRHVKSDCHNYNLKQKLRGLKLVTEVEFDKLVEDLDESLSGSDSSDTENDDDLKDSTLTTLLKKQARIAQDESEGLDEFSPKKRKRGSGKPPLIWFSTPLLPSDTSLGVYRAVFTAEEQDQDMDLVKVLRNKQLRPASSRPADASNGVPLPSAMAAPQVFMCMVGGGHFAGMIVSLTPKYGKKSTGAEERQATVIAHKTFHRYTTRRKQGGAQSSNDSAKGAAHSAGASIRRYNEAALESEIRALLTEWKDFIDKSQLIFVRATGSSNRRTLFGPYDGQVLRQNDPRNRGFPFSTRRATQAELMRSFIELTRVKVDVVDEAALAAAAAAEAASTATPKPNSTPAKPTPPKPSKEEEEATLHTTQLQALIRRSKVPAFLSYLTSNSLPADFHFHPESSQANHHAPTPLHLAASINSAPVIIALLTKANADPTTLNGEGKPPFALAGERATRDAFRVARSELGEEKWDWASSHIPSALTKEEAQERDSRSKQEAEIAEKERRKVEEEKLRKMEVAGGGGGDGRKGKGGGGKVLGAVEKTGAEKREEEGRGLTAEMRVKLERERRARAAEARMRGGA
ncbi:MAG: hypothetical protein Q9168_004673, partial [Polycauliona sp. 1 TL-2023]